VIYSAPFDRDPTVERRKRRRFLAARVFGHHCRGLRPDGGHWRCSGGSRGWRIGGQCANDLSELESGVVIVCFLQQRGKAAGGEMGHQFASVVDECVDSLRIK
jgi:hypothetical protein